MGDDETDSNPATPTTYDRTCVHPGCGKWGFFGLERGRASSGYWCKEHLPDDYWTVRSTPQN